MNTKGQKNFKKTSKKSDFICIENHNRLRMSWHQNSTLQIELEHKNQKM